MRLRYLPVRSRAVTDVNPSGRSQGHWGFKSKPTYELRSGPAGMTRSAFTLVATDTHRTDIDGLRAIAVAGAILFHFGVLPRGYLGVDVFFVISGYF